MIENWKKNISIFMATQALSLFGSSLVQYAITWYITLETKSGIYMTVSIICGFLPTFFLSPFAGVWADRYNKKKLIVLADASIAVCTLLVAVVYLLGYHGLWPLFFASIFRALGAAVQTPCVGAMIPMLVPEKELTRINGINSSVQSAIMLLSPMLSGALMGIAPLQFIFFIDVITAAIAIAIVIPFFHVPDNKTKPVEADSNYLETLKSGFSYVLQNRYLLHFFIYTILFYLMASPPAFLTSLQVARTFGDDVWRLTAMEVSFALGMTLGGIIIAAWGGFSNRVYTIAIAGICMGILTILLGFPYYFILYLIFMGLFGLVIPMFNTAAMVLLQERVSQDYMGRVFGVMSMLGSSMMPIGMLFFGPLADIFPIEYLLIAAGICILLASSVLFFDRSLLAAGRAPNGDQ